MDRVQLFINEAKNTNLTIKLLPTIRVNSANKELDRAEKHSSKEYHLLPRYVKPLCSAQNIRNYNKQEIKLESVYIVRIKFDKFKNYFIPIITLALKMSALCN